MTSTAPGYRDRQSTADAPRIDTRNPFTLRAQLERELDQLEREGYHVVPRWRGELLAQLERSDDPAALLALWRRVFARIPSATADDGRPLSPDEVRRAVDEAAGDPTKYRQLVEKFKRDG